MAHRKPAPVRQVRTTVLCVGEGFGEVRLLEHVRSLYLGGHVGHRLTVKNAKGKGAAHVVDVAIRLSRQAQYDHVAVLLDTDAAWTPQVMGRARREGVAIIKSDPCLEAWLLDVVGRGAMRASDGHKKAFINAFGFAAHDARVYSAHFPQQIIDGARGRVPNVDALLALLGV